MEYGFRKTIIYDLEPHLLHNSCTKILEIYPTLQHGTKPLLFDTYTYISAQALTTSFSIEHLHFPKQIQKLLKITVFEF